jgi:hypothetical protein
VWWELEVELNRWEGVALDEIALPYAADMLRSWPDALRRSLTWDARLAEGYAEPRAVLVRSLSPSVGEEALAGLLRAPEHAQITEVTLAGERQLAPEHLGLIASLPAFADLRALRMIGGPVSAALLEPLRASGRLATVRALALRADKSLDLPAARRLLEACGPLVELSLESAGLGADDVRALIDSGLLGGVERLALCRTGRLDDSDVPRLKRGLALTHLRALDLSGHRLTGAGMEALCEDGGLSRLEALTLVGCPLKDGSFLRHMSAICELDVSHTGLDARAAQAISDSFAMPEHLDLTSCQIGDAGVEALASGLALLQLKSLKLHDTGLTAASLGTLCAALGPQLEILCLDGCPLGPAGGYALSEVAHLNGLRMLQLRRCGLGDQGVAALARGVVLFTVYILDLSANDLTNAALHALAESISIMEVQELRLGENDALTPDGWHALATSPLASEYVKRSAGRRALRASEL